MSYEKRVTVGFKTIRVVMDLFAFWPESFSTESRIKKIFLHCFATFNFVFFALVTLGVGSFIAVNSSDFAAATEAAAIFFAILTSTIKLLALIIYRPQLRILIKDLMLTEFGRRMGVVRCAEETEGLETLNEYVSESLEQSVEEYKFLLKTYGTAVCCSLVTWSTMPGIIMTYRHFYHPEVKEKLLTFKTAAPYDITKSPYFELTYASHVYLCMLCLPGYGGSDILFSTLMIMLTRQYIIIKLVLKNIDQYAKTIFEKKLFYWLESQADGGERDLEDVYYDLVVQCVNHCARLLKINKLFNYVMGPILLTQILSSALVLCLVLFKISTEGRGPDEKIRFFVYMCANAYQLWIFCWYGQKLITETEEVANVANEIDWIKRPKRFCQGLMMVIRQSHRPQTVNAQGFADISVRTFAAVSRMALSYFTLLRSFYGK